MYGVGSALSAANGGLTLAAENAGHIAIYVATSAAVSYLSARLQGVNENNALIGALISGLANGLGGSASKDIGANVMKVLVVTALNVAAASAQGISGNQLLLIAGMSAASGLASALASSDNNITLSKSDAGSLMADPATWAKIFTATLVGLAVAKIMENAGGGFANQFTLAMVAQAAVAVASFALNTISNATQNTSSETGDGSNVKLSNDMNKLVNSMMVQGISAGIKQGFMENIRDGFAIKTYTIESGAGAKSPDEQMKDLTAGQKTELLFQQTLLEDASNLANSLGNMAGMEEIVGVKAQAEVSDAFVKDTLHGTHGYSDAKMAELKDGLDSKFLGDGEEKGTGNMLFGSDREKDAAMLASGERDAILQSFGVNQKDNLETLSAKDLTQMQDFIANKLGIQGAEMVKADVNGQEMALFFKGDQLVAAGMLNASGQKELRSFNFRFDDNGKVQLAEGKVFREVGGKYTEVGSFQFAARGSKEYQQAMARADQNIRNGEALAQVKQADAVYSEKDTDGNTTRVVYMKVDDSGNATVLASEHRMDDGKMRLLTYDTKNLGAGELSKGKIYTQDTDGKYGAQAAGTFVIKEMGIEQFSAIGKQIMQKLQTGQVGKAIVYQETMNNGATREVAMDKTSGQVQYVYTKGADGKQTVVVFGKTTPNLGGGVVVKNFNSLSQKEQTTILGSLPVMDKRDSSAMTAKLAMMQQGLQQAKMNKLMESMGFKLDAKSGENFFKLPDGTSMQILRMGEDASGKLVLEGRIMKTDSNGMKAVGEEVFITSGDSAFAKGIVGDTKGATSVIIKVNGDKSEAILLDADQKQIGGNIKVDSAKIEKAIGDLKNSIGAIKVTALDSFKAAIKPAVDFVARGLKAIIETMKQRQELGGELKQVESKLAGDKQKLVAMESENKKLGENTQVLGELFKTMGFKEDTIALAKDVLFSGALTGELEARLGGLADKAELMQQALDSGDLKLAAKLGAELKGMQARFDARSEDIQTILVARIDGSKAMLKEVAAVLKTKNVTPENVLKALGVIGGLLEKDKISPYLYIPLKQQLIMKLDGKDKMLATAMLKNDEKEILQAKTVMSKEVQRMPEGALLGDYVKNPSLGTIAGQLISYFSPLSIPAGIRDAVANGQKIWDTKGKDGKAGFVLSSLAIVPFVGGEIKSIGKATEVVEALKDIGKVEEAAAGLKTEIAVFKTEAGVAAETVNNLKKTGQIVLGRYPAYIDTANELAAKRFSVPEDIWKKMSDAEKWTANQKFLDRAIEKGNEIILASPVSEAEAGTFFRKEIDYLISQGYRFAEDGSKMIRP
jgi:hypothetical protein